MPCPCIWLAQGHHLPSPNPNLQGERKGTVFLKRHRVPKPDGGFYGVNDLKVGVQIDLYSRVLQVTDADGFTRAFMEKIGNPLDGALSTPADPYTNTREDLKQQIVRNQKYFHPRCADDDLIRAPRRRTAPPHRAAAPRRRTAPHRTAPRHSRRRRRRRRRAVWPAPQPCPRRQLAFTPCGRHLTRAAFGAAGNMEARLGCSSTLLEPDKLDQFLKYDRKVLRFYLAWDDRRSLYGELRPFVLHYYLADDSMEVLEVRRANAGRDPFPLFLKRGKVYKDIDSYLNIDAPTTHAGLVRQLPIGPQPAYSLL